MNKDEFRRRILCLVYHPKYRPLKPRAIARQLGLPHEDSPKVRRLVKEMVSSGTVTWGANHMVRPVALPPDQLDAMLREIGDVDAPANIPADASESPPPSQTEKAPPDAPRHRRRRPDQTDLLRRQAENQGWIVGTFNRREKGHGYVRPRQSDLGDAAVVDIYIPAKETQDAARGDLVAVELSKSRRRETGNQLRGRVVQILERQSFQFVGTYVESGGSGYVRVDGTVFRDAIFVGDARASGASPGDKVVIEMLRFPTQHRDGEAVITEILGPRGKPGVDTLTVLREFNLPDEFDDDVLDEARRVAAHHDEDAPQEDRYDATEETTVTIDPPDARDFDDAVSLERLEDGRWRLGVHIADVSHFVQPRSSLDRAARERATSVYLPGTVIAMLPELISNGLASLQPRKRRLTKSVYIHYSEDGAPLHVELKRSVIRSDKRLTYEQVDAFLADRPRFRKSWGAKVHDLVGRMHELAMILRRRRLDAGSIELHLPEIKLDLDGKGRVTGAKIVEQTESHQIIEEFMLAANTAVARHLESKAIPFLRRIHAPPSERKMRELARFVEEMRIPGVRLSNMAGRGEIQRLLAKVEGRPEQRAVNYFLLRSFQRAEYSPQEEEHYALAFDCYCHFTSPIRRYPDLLIHRALDDLLQGKRPRPKLDELRWLGRHCSDRQQRADAAERELVQLKLLGFLSERIGLQMDAIVTGVEPFGLFVQGLQLPADGLIRVDGLADDHYHYDRDAHALSGYRSGNTYRLGDALRVELVRTDPERREIDFWLLRRLTSDEAKERIREITEGRGAESMVVPEATATQTTARRPGGAAAGRASSPSDQRTQGRDGKRVSVEGEAAPPDDQRRGRRSKSKKSITRGKSKRRRR